MRLLALAWLASLLSLTTHAVTVNVKVLRERNTVVTDGVSGFISPTTGTCQSQPITNPLLPPQGFNQMSYDAMQKLSADPLVDITFQMIGVGVSTNCDSTTACDYGAPVDSIFADQSTNTPSNTLFIMMGFDLDTYVAAIATAHPTYMFVQIDSCPWGQKADLDNVVCALFQEDQVAFAAGAVAAMASTTGVVGGVFGAPLAPLLRFENGFKQGARFTNPNIKVETQVRESGRGAKRRNCTHY